MKKIIGNIEKQAATEAWRMAYVLAGFVMGRSMAALMNLAAEKLPDWADTIKYSKAPLQAIGGFLLCSASAPDAELTKSFGYGFTASAGLEIIKIIPLAKDVLGDVQLENTFYREDDKPSLQIGSFGMNALPIRSVELGEVKPIEVELPPLETSGSTSDLGYSGSITQQGDDMKGIL